VEEGEGARGRDGGDEEENSKKGVDCALNIWQGSILDFDLHVILHHPHTLPHPHSRESHLT